MVRRIIAVAFAIGLITVALSAPAWADEQWCETDPIFIVANVPVRVVAGLSIDPAQIDAVTFELHVASGTSVFIVPSGNASLPESTTVVDDLPAGAEAQLIVRVATIDAAQATAVLVNVYGPTALQPNAYTATTNASLAITLPDQ